MPPPLDDIDRAMAVMQAAFDPAFGEAWTRRQLEDSLLSGHCQLTLIGPDGAPPADAAPAAGFALVRTMIDEQELLLLAIDPLWRRRGLGAKLLEQIIASAHQHGMVRMLLEMRAGNSAENLYRAFSFEAVGKRTKYFRTPSGEMLDAITFSRSIAG